MALSFGAQLEFARDFAAYSGMSGNVVLAWCLQEQPPGHPATPGSNNWLNIQYTDSGPNSTYYRIAKLNPADAARASVVWMNENLPSIPASKGKSEYEQAKAIVESGWASSHYGGVTKFYGVVQEVARSKLEKTPPAPKLSESQAGIGGVNSVVKASESNDPPSHAPKVQESGRKMGAVGSSFAGHAVAMRNLASRTLTLK